MKTSIIEIKHKPTKIYCSDLQRQTKLLLKQYIRNTSISNHLLNNSKSHILFYPQLFHLLNKTQKENPNMRKIYKDNERKNIPAQDLMVWILRSKTRTLAKWVMSPANLNIFIFSSLCLLLSVLVYVYVMLQSVWITGMCFPRKL